jgi:hypothetical protein
LSRQLSVTDSISILRRRFPGALICTACARLIASTPAGYTKLNLSRDALGSYVCASCRSDADPARSAEVTTRFAASKAAAEAARLRAPLAGLSPCTCTPIVTCASCLQALAAEAAEGRRIAHNYLDTCATNGHHSDLETLADCPHPSATVVDPHLSPVFCEHARPADECIAHAKLSPGTPMPAALVRCESCGSWHGKNGRDRCPYSRDEAAAVRAARRVRNTSETTYRRQMPPVPDSDSRIFSKINGLSGTISHLRNASKRLGQKPGRPATGTSKWARLRRTQRGDVD